MKNRIVNLVLSILTILCFTNGCVTNEYRKPIYAGSNLTFPSLEETSKYYGEQGVANGLADQISEIETNFYVLAPQDYVDDNGVSGKIGIRDAIVGQGEDAKQTQVLSEEFLVCNEQKYGKQVTDWGQKCGIPFNFHIFVTIDVNYKSPITQLKFDYGEESLNSVSWCDLYNGEECFAYVSWIGYGYENKEEVKTHIETYCKENLMKKSEYLQKHSSGEFKQSSCIVEKTDRPSWRGYHHLYRLTNCSEQLYSSGYLHTSAPVSAKDVEDLEKACVKYSNVYLCPNEKGNTELEIVQAHAVANSKNEDNELIDALLKLEYYFFDFDYGGQPNGGESGNFGLTAYLTSIDADSIDVALITIDWAEKECVNVYYDGYCFATVELWFSSHGGSKITENSYEFYQEYCEDFIKNNLKLIR